MTADRLITKTIRTVVVLYVITVVHHVIEGLGWVFEFRLRSLITPVTFGFPLLMTLGLLLLYRRTRHWVVLAAFACTTLLWWVVGIGLSDGLYNHTANLVLSLAHVPAAVLRTLYPSYVPPPANGGFTMPCDGVRYSYCAIKPATITYEVAGIASFVVACPLALDVYRLVMQQRRDRTAPPQDTSRRAVVGASLGAVMSFGAAPLIGMYMASGKLAVLVIALAFTVVGASALIGALVATSRSHSAEAV